MWQPPEAFVYIALFIDFFMAFFFLTLFFRTKLIKESKENIEPEITFILPAYNVAKVIEKSILSIKKVRYNQEKIRIIIVDDGSKDNTYELAKNLAKKYLNISVFTKKNGGKSDALNFGIKKARTELIAVLDADTLLKEDMLEKAIPLFDKRTMAVTARMKPLNNTKILEKLQHIEYTFAGFFRKIMGHINSLSVAPAFTIFRREFFKKNPGFDKGNLTEDLEMGMRIQSKHYNISYVADSYAITDVPDTFWKLFRQRLRWGYGTFFNYIKYKGMFFNLKYGDLGAFILPAGIVSIMLMSAVFLLGFYTIGAWFLEHIKLLFFGWEPTFAIDLGRLLIYATDLRIMMFIAAIFIGLAAYFLIRYELDEDLKFRHYALYITAYLWMLGLFYIIALIYFIIGRKPKW